MPVTSVVITLAESARGHDGCAGLGVLARDPRVHIGRVATDRVAVALESENADEGYELLQRLADQPGVIQVEVIGVDFSDLEPARETNDADRALPGGEVNP